MYGSKPILENQFMFFHLTDLLYTNNTYITQMYSFLCMINTHQPVAFNNAHIPKTLHGNFLYYIQ